MQNSNATDADHHHDPELRIISYSLTCGSSSFFSDLENLAAEHFSKDDTASIYRIISDLYKNESVERITSDMFYSFAKTNGIPQEKINKKYAPVLDKALSVNITKDEAKINLKEIKKYFVIKKLNQKIE